MRAAMHICGIIHHDGSGWNRNIQQGPKSFFVVLVTTLVPAGELLREIKPVEHHGAFIRLFQSRVRIGEVEIVNPTRGWKIDLCYFPFPSLSCIGGYSF